MSVRGFQADIVENWTAGVATAILADRLPNGAVSGAKNTQFYHVGPDHAVLGTRAGCTVQNTTALASRARSQYYLNTTTSDTHLLQLDNGNLMSFVAGTPTTIGAGVFTQPTEKSSWASFENWAYVVNGTDFLKTDGASVEKFGIRQPLDSEWAAVATTGGSSLPADTYDLVIQYFNSSTGHGGPESDSKQVVIAAGQRIKVTIPAASTIADPQVDYVKIYLQQEDTRNAFFLVVAGTTPAISGTSGWTVAGAASDVYIDSTQDQIDVFVTVSPGVNNNYPPPSGAKYLVTNHQRMFVADSNTLFWSDAGEPESFNTTDNAIPVGEDGEYITGLAPLGENLIIFKRRSIYVLQGLDPASWQLNLLDNTIGCVGHLSIGNFDNRLWWMSLQGPCMWSGPGSSPVEIAQKLIDDQFDETAVHQNDLADCVIVGAPSDHFVGWAITPVGQSTNTLIIPFNFKLDRWMSNGWEMVDVLSCTVVNDSNGRPWPMIADYDGFVYRVGDSTNDGVPNGQTQEGTLTGATSTTVSVAGAGWTAGSLVGRYVTVWVDGNLNNAQRRKITTNTSTTLTVATWDATPSIGDHFIIGGILMDWRGAFRNGSGDGSGAFYKKRIEILFLELTASTGGDTCEVQVFKDMDPDTVVRSREFVIGSGALWGTAIWGEDVWAGRSELRIRFPIRTQGYSWQVRILHMSNGNQLTVGRTAMQWLTKTRKVGG